ncbi:phasin family protein [Telmatospirillum sp. J64-1]|uniref:phasin family protein n=1 Tax=Telmatospirillum sp. J64-1 TaxID=2502183 RepID=UPI00163DE429|nr:phasin family protein [Telmatospirillum sp. J64-1]
MIKSYEEIMAFGKGNIEAMVKSSTLAAKGFEEMGKAYQSLAGQSAEKAQAAAKALAACKTPQELIEVQTKLTREGIETAVAESRKFAEMTSTVIASSMEPLNARIAAFQSLASKAA